MKKRVKLLTTIASLCLAVALMAFGVYAATSATINVTSNISFSATDIEATWEIAMAGYKEVAKDDVTNEIITSGYDFELLGTEEANTTLATFTITFSNNSTEKGADLTFSAEAQGTDAAKFSVTTTVDPEAATSCAAGDTVTYTVVVKTAEKIDATRSYSAKVVMTGEATPSND